MSFLAPLYILGALGLALPVLLHLIRRLPQGRMQFSSLMFLTPSPPRLSRRSRLDNLLLLILRCVALALLVLAFARPFLREAAALVFSARGGQYVLVLLDTSASMRRTGVWQSAVERVEQVLDAARDDDRVGLLAFDSHPRTLVSLADLHEIPSASQRLGLLRQRLAETKPGWAHTNLGGALATAADQLESAADAAGEDAPPQLRVVLVSDLQRGSDLTDLQAFQWPAGVSLQVEAVQAGDPSNAGLQALAPSDAQEAGSVALRVLNDAESASEQFRLEPVDKPAAEGPPASSPVYVPPGQSRVVRLTAAAAGQATGYRLLGDAHDFDNTAYLAPPRRQRCRVVYVGRDAPNDPQGLQYYLQRACTDTAAREFQFLSRAPDEALPGDEPLDLVVVGDPPQGAGLTELDQYLAAGGTVLLVVRDGSAAAVLQRWLGSESVAVTDPPPGEYVLLADIDWDHPLFIPFSAPQYGDFTKIHFWNHRRLVLPERSAVQILARFDNGDVALCEQSFPSHGRLLVLTSGWNPRDSQLALSTKFIPLLSQLLPGGGEQLPSSSTVGQAIELPRDLLQAGPVTIRRPDGSTEQLADGEERFVQTDQPGLYHVDNGDRRHVFAVNVATAESRTEPLGVEELESCGALLAGPARAAADEVRQRQMLDVQLERTQQLWRWLILAAILVLIVETWLAGRTMRSRQTQLA